MTLPNQTVPFINGLDREPENKNNFYGNRYKLVFAKLPNVEFFCQVIMLPSVTIGVAVQAAPIGIPLKWHGDTVAIDPLTVVFLVNENAANWYEIINWMQQIVPFERMEGMAPYKDLFSDAHLLFLDSEGKTTKKLKFNNTIPVRLGQIKLSTIEFDTTPIVCDLTLQHTGFIVENTETT
jgi:hypothetical protein